MQALQALKDMFDQSEKSRDTSELTMHMVQCNTMCTTSSDCVCGVRIYIPVCDYLCIVYIHTYVPVCDCLCIVYIHKYQCVIMCV